MKMLPGRYLAGALAGLCLAAAFPRIGIAGLAWVAPALMVAPALGRPGGEAFRIGYAAGLTYYLVSLYWLLLIPYRWHGVPLGPATGWLCLSGLIALFPATWVWATCRAAEAGGRKAEVGGQRSEAGDQKAEAGGQEAEAGGQRSEVGGQRSEGEGGRAEEGARLPAALDRWLPRLPSPTWRGRAVWALYGAAAWVGLEMLLTRFLGGFPWDFLGVSQYHLAPLIQVASVTGVYGVSFLAVWFSLSLLSAGVVILRRPASRSFWIAEMFIPTLAVAVAFNLGFSHIRHSEPPGRTLAVTLLQPSIPQTLIWDSSNSAERFQDLLRLSEAALTNHTDLLVWPESAIPELLRYDERTAREVLGVAQRHHVWMIVSADDFQRREHATRPDDGDFSNCAFLISRDGRLTGRYQKRNLVIFGEYVPLARWLPFLKWFTPIQGGFAPGQRAEQFHLDSLDATASPLICYEDMFPHLGRSDVEAGTDFLVNLTNDGWFGESAEQWQHAAAATFRAVENGVPLVRCANTGITCWIDAQGRLREIFQDPAGSVYGRGFLSFDLPLPAEGQKHTPTFYNRHGDLFGWACAGMAGLALAWSLLKRPRASLRPPGSCATEGR